METTTSGMPLSPIIPIEEASHSSSSVSSVFDKVPTEVLLALGQYLDRRTLYRSVQVSSRWHATLLPLLWTRIDIRQWHSPSFPLLRLMLPGHVQQVHHRHQNNLDSRYSETVIRAMLNHVRTVEWWANDSITKAHDPLWFYPTFRSALSPSAQAAALRGDKSIAHPFENWCFDGKTQLPGHRPLVSVLMPRLGRFLIEETSNLTSLSIRFGPSENINFLQSLVRLPQTMTHLKLIGSKWNDRLLAIEDIFPLLSRLEELELKGYFFFHEPNHPWYQRQQQAHPQEPAAWKLKRLATKIDGLILAQNCPNLIEYQLEFNEPLERLEFFLTQTPFVSFKPLEACRDSLQILDFSGALTLFKYRVIVFLGFVQTRTKLQHLTDLSFIVNDLEQVLFLCEQQEVQSRQGQPKPDGNNELESEQSVVFDYPHMYLPHLQHLVIRVVLNRHNSNLREPISHCLYWILMTRTKLLTFKIPNHPLNLRLLASPGLLNLEPSSIKRSDDRTNTNEPKMTPSPLWPSTAHFRDHFRKKIVTGFLDDIHQIDDVYLIPEQRNRFWACTRLEHLSLIISLKVPVQEHVNGTTRQARNQFWRPMYRQLAELTELRSLRIESRDLEKGSEAGILQWAEGGLFEEVGIPIVPRQATATGDGGGITATTQTSCGVSRSCSSEGYHDPFVSRLPKLRYLGLVNSSGSFWTRHEIHRLCLLIPSLEQVELKPLQKGLCLNVKKWFHEFGGVQPPQRQQNQGHQGQEEGPRRRIPVKLLDGIDHLGQ